MQDSPLSARARRQPSMLLYIAGFGVAISGIQAATLILGDSSFQTLVTTLCLIGFLASFISRAQGVTPRSVEAPAIAVCILIVLMAAFTDPAESFLAPANAHGDRSHGLIVLLVWLSVLLSFTLITDSAILFMCVPSAAIFGLISTSSTDQFIVDYFILMIFCAVFVMVHEGARRSRSGREGRSAKSWNLVSQSILVSLCAGGAWFCAGLITPHIQNFGSMLRVAGGLPAGQSAASAASAQRTQFDERTDVPIATGPVRRSDEVVLSVKSPESHPWRGATLDWFTGRAWTNRLRDTITLRGDRMPNSRVAPTPDQFHIKLPEGYLTSAVNASHTIKQYFRLRSGIFNQYYGAAESQEVWIPQNQMTADHSGSLKPTDMMSATEYVVESRISEFTSESRSAQPGQYPTEISNRYLQLPTISGNAIDRIRTQAKEITQGETSTLGKVTRLKEWIASQCKYNTNIAAYPNDAEVVSHFIFQERQGYCDVFATSLAVMCRTIGIPARVATGFNSGEKDEAAGEFIVRERDKHMWTEIYFNGVGWKDFDATENAEVVQTNDAERTVRKGGILAAIFRRGWLPPTALALALILILYVIKVEVYDRRRAQLTATTLAATNRAVIEAWNRACGILARRGLKRERHETPSEYLSRCEQHLFPFESALFALRRLTESVNYCRWGMEVAPETAVNEANGVLAQLNSGLKSAPRRFSVKD